MPANLDEDQVFQLNTVLWTLQDVAPQSGIHPILRDAGYYLRAIGQRLQMPVAESQLDALHAVAGTKDRSPTQPDLWLSHQTDDVDPIIELKAHSFGFDSTNARQASKVLLSVSNLGPSLGSAQPVTGHAIYLTPASDSPDMAGTLAAIATALTEAGATTGATGALGIAVTDVGVVISSPGPQDLPTPMGVALVSPVVVLDPSAEGDSIQPLYFVPWIPGIHDVQDPELQADGLRELTARVLTHAIAHVGMAQPPGMVVLSCTDLLDRATFGVFRHWRDSDRQQFVSAAAKIVQRALSKTVTISESSGSVQIDLPSTEAQAAAIERLEDADPADPTKSLAAALAEPPTLFDEVS
jgi:hypothetical protein